MPKQIKFAVDGKVFACHADLMKASSFSVKSALKNYTVFFEEEKAAVDTIKSLYHDDSVWVVDKNIFHLYFSELLKGTKKIFLVDAKEQHKTINTVFSLIDFFEKKRVTKKTKVVVVGGGITQELAGFACAIYKRGIPWIYLPTTLLSMSDSCIGGKTSLNYNNAKNQLGVFSPPSEVYINAGFLNTLPQTEINSGMGEILKSCLIGGEYFLNLYESKKNILTLIKAALCVKKTIVEADEFEENHRKVLNYGHTFGHVIESLSEYRIPHGLAVVLGMMLVNQLSFQKNILSKGNLDKINKHCCALLDKKILEEYKKMDLGKIEALIKKDKKTQNSYTHFVFMIDVGQIIFLKLHPKAFSGS
jgi:3-dehydroquinate synthase